MEPRLTLTWSLGVRHLVEPIGRPGQLVPASFSYAVRGEGWQVSATVCTADDGTVTLAQVIAEGDLLLLDWKLRDWTASALDGAARIIRDRVRVSPASVQQAVSDEEVPTGSFPLPDEHLVEVAKIFTSAETEPINAVADHFLLTRSTARGRVNLARKRGLL